MTACDNPEEHYQFGVDLFIGGLAAIAAARAGATGSAPARLPGRRRQTGNCEHGTGAYP